MKKIFILLLIALVNIYAQTNVFTDNFSTSQGSTYFTSGKIGSSNWDINRSGADFGARINNGILDLTNDASTTTNAAGWIYVNQPISNIASPFNSTLNSNTGKVTWTFNLRQSRTDPAGFGNGSYGVAFIIGSTSQSPQTTGTGYAVVLGQSGSVDPIRLIKFSGGLQSSDNLITSNTSGLTDFGVEYLSIKVTFDPSTKSWELFLRNDGTTAFADPLTGTLTTQGTIVDSTYTSSSLGFWGAYWQGSTSAGQTSYFDNINISVTSIVVPESPLAIAATNVTQTSFTANWNASSGATKYYLDIATDIAFTNFVTGYQNKDVGNVTSENVTGLNSSTTYYYRVRAENSAGQSGNSNVINLTTLSSSLDAPTAAEADNITQTSFRANWNSSSGATKYYLDVAIDNAFTNFVTGYENKDVGNVNNEIVTGLSPNTNYYYRVRASDGIINSSNSNIINLTTLPNIPASPLATAATNVTQTSFTANWNASTDATKYYLDVAIDNAFTNFITGYENKDVGNVTSENVTGLNSSTTYYYRVRAANLAGSSSNSNSIDVLTSAQSVGIIVNEWSQGSSVAKEWVELLVVEDNLNIQNYKLIDGNNSLSITLSGTGFQNVRKGSLIVIYNGGDVDGLISPDLTYDGVNDKNLILSSLNNSGTWALTRTNGWNSTTGAFSNSTNTDVPQIQNSTGTIIFTTPKFAGSNQIAYFTEDSEAKSLQTTNWNTSTSSNGTPGQPNGGNNSIWITTTLSTGITTAPSAPIAVIATSITNNGFTANWNVSTGATKYYLDVATDNLFTNFVTGYENKDVGNVTSENITGLNPLSNYYYRVRASNSFGTSDNSNVVQVTTLTNQTSVQFITTSGSVYESAGVYNITFSITNPSATNSTIFDVVVTGGTATLDDINNYITQQVSFPAGSSSNRTLQININNDGIAEGAETVIFSIQNVTGDNSAIVGVNSTFTLTINDPVAGDYYSGVNTTLNGQAFKAELHNLIKGHTAYPYTSSSTDVWDILMDAYEDPSNPNNVILIYSGRSQTKTYNSSTLSNDPNAWNREHIFAQSRGGFSVNNNYQNPGVATDAHNLAPEDASINSDRGNKDFDIGGTPHPEAIGCFMDADSFEPRDAVKGDIARILFYMDVRYEGDNGEPQLELYDGVNTPVGTIGKLSTLLLWHQQDPPDAFEIARNNKIYNYQNNKNPFIDHPEWVAKIYGSNNAPTISNINRNVTVPNEEQDLLVSANIIDDGTISSAQIIYSINGGAQQFSNMSITSGNLYTGTIPEIAFGNGDLIEYKIKAVDNETNERISESYKVFAGITPISTLHQVDANGVLIYNNIYAKVRGVATVPNGLFSTSNLEVNLQDNSGGIVIYKVTAGSTPFIVGKNYTVSGSLTQYNGLAELVPNNTLTDIIDNGTDVEIQPTVKTFAELIANPEQYEGMLIKVKNVNKISGTWGASQNLTVTDGTSNNVTLRISSGTNLPSNPEPAWPKDVVGIFTQFDSSLPYTGDYQLKPRSINDIQQIIQPTKYIVTSNNNNPTVGATIGVTAQLADDSGNPIAVAGKVLTWTSTNGGSFENPTSITNSNGIAANNFTVSNQAGVNHVISVSDNSTPHLTGQSNSITTVANSAAGFIVSVSDENPVAGNQIIVNAQLVDIFNNPVNIAGVNVNWSSTNGGSFSSASTLTNANGVATVNFVTNVKAGLIHVISAKSGTSPNIINGQSNQILTKSGNPVKYIVLSNDNNPVVNSQIFITAQLVDANNNQVKLAGKVVNWSSTNGGIFSSSSTLTNANGLAEVIFTVSKKSNTEHLITSSDNDGLIGTSELIKAKSGNPSKFILLINDLFPNAGSEINLKCQLTDEFENNVEQAGMNVIWSVTNLGVLQNEITSTNENGIANNILKVSSKANESHIVTVKSVNNPNINGTSNEIRVLPNVGKKYLITVNNSNPFVGNSIEVEAQLVDEFNNNVLSEGNVLTWSSTNEGSFENINTSTNSEGKSKNIFIVNLTPNIKHIISVVDNFSRIGSSSEVITKSIEIPVLISPADNEKSIPLENTFVWNSLQNIDGYEFQLSEENNFTLNKINQFIKDNSIKVSDLEIGKRYFWRVRAKKEKGYSNWSTIWSFKTLPPKPDKPYLIYPANKTLNQNVITLFKWNKIENADNYLIQISDLSNFSNIIFENNETVENEFKLKTLKHNTKYFWRVRAKNISGESEFSDTWNFTTIDTIIAPSNLTAYIDVNGNVVLNWQDNSNNEKGFKLERHDPAGIDYYQFDETNENVTSYIVNYLEGGKKYKFRVKGFNSSTFSDYSNIVEISTPSNKIASPTDLKAMPNVNGFVELSWKDNSNDEDGFIIFRQDENNSNNKSVYSALSSYFVPIDTVNKNITYYLDKSTTFNKKYNYQIIAYNQNGTSLPTHLKNEIKPIKSPTNLTAKISNDDIILTWNDNSDSETEFIILKATKPKMEFDLLTKVPSNTTNYFDIKVLDGKKYFYKIYAIENEIGISAFSNIDSAMIKMKTPTNLVAKQTNNMNKIELYWKDNSQSENGYIIERKELTENIFAELFATLANSTSYIDNSVDNKKNYIYRVKGFNEEGYSDYSNETSVLVGIEDQNELPTQFYLSQNYPNPFNPETIINYKLPKESNVKLTLFDMMGREIAVLVNERKSAGSHFYKLSTKKINLSSGTYYYKLQADEYIQTKKLVILK